MKVRTAAAAAKAAGSSVGRLLVTLSLVATSFLAVGPDVAARTVQGPPPAPCSKASDAVALRSTVTALASSPVAALSAELSSAAASSPQQAVSRSASNAAAFGVTQAISVLDRSTGTQLGSTANANSQIASESIMKLLLAAYYLVLYGGYTKTPSDVRGQLSYMLRYSDDTTASALFTANAIPTIAARYGLSRTTNATDRAGHWGAARITARDMTVFLYRASKDAAVGPWLIPVMAQTNATGSDGFNQKFGLNALSGTHGSKQGWGADSYWTSQAYAIHSVGYTSRYFVAVLQLGPATTYADPMRGLATTGAQWIQVSGTASASPPALTNGTFIRVAGTSHVYRIVGGAPLYISSWGPWGRSQPVVTISRSQWNTLAEYPAEGTSVKVRQSGNLYRIAGHSAIRIGSLRASGGSGDPVQIDGNAITRAATSSVYRHLRAEPLDKTFLRAHSSGNLYRIVGNAPVRVTSWSAVGGTQTAVEIDGRAITGAGTPTWHNLSAYPRNGTYLRAYASGRVYRMAGGAPLYAPTSVSQGDPINVDAAAISNGGRPGTWAHLRYRPATGTFLRTIETANVYRVVSGVARRVTSWAPYGGSHPTVAISRLIIERAGQPSPYDHLKSG